METQVFFFCLSWQQYEPIVTIYTVSSEMFLRTLFLLIFTNLLDREVLANIENTFLDS